MKVSQAYAKREDCRKIPESATLPSNCLFGIEIELEEAVLGDFQAQYWGAKDDGSLRTVGRGRHSLELVLVQPLGGKDLELALGELRALIAALSPKCSDRCSVHVHMDVRDLELSTYHILVALSMYVEPVLFSLVKSEDREENAFCLPSYKIVRPDKYRGVNVAATAAYGSIEYRMHGPYRDIPTIINLLWFLDRLRTLAGRITVLDSVQVNKELDITYTQSTKLISSEIAAQLYLLENVPSPYVAVGPDVAAQAGVFNGIRLNWAAVPRGE